MVSVSVRPWSRFIFLGHSFLLSQVSSYLCVKIIHDSSMKKLHPFMLAGTGSDVGKSVLAAALCRILRQDGYRPAPFKAQNMSLNSYATPEGFEIGRAQAVQAEAAGIPCHTDMNPVLLKPNSDHTSQVVLNGRPVGNSSAYDYFRRGGLISDKKDIMAALSAGADARNCGRRCVQRSTGSPSVTTPSCWRGRAVLPKSTCGTATL